MAITPAYFIWILTVYRKYCRRTSSKDLSGTRSASAPIDEAVLSGFSASRTAGELSWAVEGRDECDRLVAYEQKVQASYPRKRAAGMCMYPIRSFEKWFSIEWSPRTIRLYEAVKKERLPRASTSIGLTAKWKS